MQSDAENEILVKGVSNKGDFIVGDWIAPPREETTHYYLENEDLGNPWCLYLNNVDEKDKDLPLLDSSGDYYSFKRFKEDVIYNVETLSINPKDNEVIREITYPTGEKNLFKWSKIKGIRIVDREENKEKIYQELKEEKLKKIEEFSVKSISNLLSQEIRDKVKLTHIGIITLDGRNIFGTTRRVEDNFTLIWQIELSNDFLKKF